MKYFFEKTKFVYKKALFGSLALASLVLSLTACSFFPKAPQSNGKQWNAAFGYRKWVTDKIEPKVVLIGVHGFCGTSKDFNNIGCYLQKNQPTTFLYAYDLRGQGNDPELGRRGDIHSPSEWYRDLVTFHHNIRKMYPNAKIIWYGESLGSMIVTHTWASSSMWSRPTVDGFILSSPVVRLSNDIPSWTPQAVLALAHHLPETRISLDAFIGASGQHTQMTQESKNHAQQANKNSYHLNSQTLRLIGTIVNHISTMKECAPKLNHPVLVLHGDRDFFNNDAEIRSFVTRIPKSSHAEYYNFPNAYHLLMYDVKKEKVFEKITRWIDTLEK